jgi:WG containing repeat
MTSGVPHIISFPVTHSRHQVLIVFEGCAYAPAEHPRRVLAFAPDKSGGFIAPAQADNERWGYINERGQWQVAPTLDSARTFSDNGIARFQQEGRWGFVNTDGKVIIAATHHNASPFKHGLAAVETAAHAWRYVLPTGEIAFEGEYGAAGPFSTIGLAAAATQASKKMDSRFGFIDREGRWAIQPQFIRALAFGKDGVAPASLDGDNWGLIDQKGHWVVEPKYADINGFNEDGLARFSMHNSWDNGNGFVNAKGEEVIAGERDLGRQMVSGIVTSHYNGSSYLTKTGAKLETPRLSFGCTFNSMGLTLARTANSQWSEQEARHVPQQAKWGILHADGSFKAFGDDVLEPLTNSDGWLDDAQAAEHHPFFKALATNGDLVCLDHTAQVVYRVCYDRQSDATVITLLDAAGKQLWQSMRMADVAPPLQPFFVQPLQAHLSALTDASKLVEFARDLTAKAQAKLHAYAGGAEMDDAELGDAEHDEGDADDDTDEEACAARQTTLVRRLARVYVNEHHTGHYEFLFDQHSKVIQAGFDSFVQQLTQAFGEHDPDPDIDRTPQQSEVRHAWPVALTVPINPNARYPQTNQLWLTISCDGGTGDGDQWLDMWLACGPSKDALDAAQRLRAAGHEGGVPHGTDGAGPDDSKSIAQPQYKPPHKPQRYEEWMSIVQEDRSAIGAVPQALLDDALVDAAIKADVRALAYVPHEWQTAARLERIIRQGVNEARDVPPHCMTQTGLELARSLYGNDDDWNGHDERHSKIPTDWDHNSLYSVWGALVTQANVIKALKAGESLNHVPPWLRSPEVERTALDADISNIIWMPASRITPKLADLAVRDGYSNLIQYLPDALITPQRCLACVNAHAPSLEFVPEALRSQDVCVAAMKGDANTFAFVPPLLREAVCDQLIGEDLEKGATPWHHHRAWSRLLGGDFQGAVEDATLAISVLEYPVHAHYVRAAALQAMGRSAEAALDAATVLSSDSDYEEKFPYRHGTAWLRKLAEGAFEAEQDDAPIVEQLRGQPLALARVPRERITQEMVDVAVAADPHAVQFVPKRLMTSALYVIAIRTRRKRFIHIPKHMLTEAACIEEVTNDGGALQHIPEEWRTPAVCKTAVSFAPYALQYVPKPLQENAKVQGEQMARQREQEDDTHAAGDGDSDNKSALDSWLHRKITDSLLDTSSNKSATSRFGFKALFGAFVVKVALSAKDSGPVHHRGVLGWLEQRPAALMLINAALALIALIAHVFVTVAAWKAEGVWIGLLTAALMGFSELYWAWRFLFETPVQWGLGVTAILVIAYTFVFKPIHTKVAMAIAAKHANKE